MAELLVTGATGCIGRALLDAALNASWSVRGLARSERPAWWPGDARYVRADVQDADAVARASVGCQAIVHLAAPVHTKAQGMDAREMHRITADGAASAAKAANRAGAALLLVSTVAVYGTPPPLRCDERTPTRPTTPYARAKLAAEERSLVIHGAPIVLRCAVVYGVGDRGNVGRLMRSIDRGRGLIVGSGQNRKSILFAGNLADRILRSLTDGKMNGTWCVADSPAISQRELIREIALVLGRRPPRSVPLWLAMSGARGVDVVNSLLRSRESRWSEMLRTLAATTVVDGLAIDDRLSYRQRFTLREGLEQTAAWLRASD